MRSVRLQPDHQKTLTAPSSDRTFPGFEHPYRIQDPFNRRASRHLGRPGNPWVGRPGNPWDEAWIRADELPVRATRLRHAMGSDTPPDCIWTTSQALTGGPRSIWECRLHSDDGD